MPEREGGNKKPFTNQELVGKGDKIEGYVNKDSEPQYRKAVSEQKERLKKENIKIKPQEFDKGLNQQKTNESIDKAQAKANKEQPEKKKEAPKKSKPAKSRGTGFGKGKLGTIIAAGAYIIENADEIKEMAEDVYEYFTDDKKKEQPQLEEKDDKTSAISNEDKENFMLATQDFQEQQPDFLKEMGQEREHEQPVIDEKQNEEVARGAVEEKENVPVEVENLESEQPEYFANLEEGQQEQQFTAQDKEDFMLATQDFQEQQPDFLKEMGQDKELEEPVIVENQYEITDNLANIEPEQAQFADENKEQITLAWNDFQEEKPEFLQDIEPEDMEEIDPSFLMDEPGGEDGDGDDGGDGGGGDD